MAVNQLESNLEAITRTIAHLKQTGCTDEKKLNELREERDKILSDLKIL
ncbi:MAG: hypothetical protein HUK28_05045 [Methanobrevibacter sp.]|nr:hypothetical protein [Methanobrevibacter sp.]